MMWMHSVIEGTCAENQQVPTQWQTGRRTLLHLFELVANPLPPEYIKLSPQSYLGRGESRY